MITEQDLRAAIAECQGERNPNAQTCMKLAAYYTILNNLYPAERPSYSYDAAPVEDQTMLIDYQSKTDFGQEIQGKPMQNVLKVLDELAATLQVVQPRMYNGLMRKLKDI